MVEKEEISPNAIHIASNANNYHNNTTQSFVNNYGINT
jgi:hypothetical protein